ncbi:tape measure protein [Methylocystis heyeri]|uniref:Tape measure protein n=1 Tax=Methylocystis heyeri TaxID=391905 RepID=A0A6B8KDZ3_9HYPH|nr:tape measure protein [Methylocystis heyeri]QGM46664.1 tape measure protein [Methylocystis heyeri]
MASDEQVLLTSLEARIINFEKAFARASRVADSSWSAIEARGKAGAAKMEAHVAQATKGMHDKFSEMGKEIGVIFAEGLGIRELQKMADEWTAFSGRIAATGVATEDLHDKLQQLSDIAIRSHASLEQVGKVYTAVGRGAKEVGANEAQAVQVTETLMKAFALGGQPVETTNAAILEFSHALGAGRANMQEFNKLAFEAPILMDAIAKELGISASKLHEYMKEGGEVTSAQMIKAILHAKEQIEQQFGKLKPTIEQSLAGLETAMSRWIGQTDEGIGVTKTISEAIQGLGHNIDIVAPSALALAAALALAFSPQSVAFGGIAAAVIAIAGFSDKIHPIAGEMTTLADLVRAAFELVKEAGGEAAAFLEEKFAQASKLLSDIFSGVGVPLETFLTVVKTLGNAVITVFVGTAEGIKASWQNLGPAIGDITLSMVNKIIENVEWMANKVVESLNSISDLMKRFTGVDLGHASTIDLGRVQNGFVGAGKAAGDAFEQGFKSAAKDYIGGMLGLPEKELKALEDKAKEIARQREEAAKKPKKDEGSLGQTLKDSEDPKKIKAYNELLTKQKEFIQNQEIQLKAAQMQEHEGAVLVKEQELWNEAASKGIELTEKQKEELHKMAEAGVTAQENVKSFQDLKQSTKELSDALSSELGGALDKIVTRSAKLRDVLRELAVALLKMVMEAALLGKGPLAGVMGLKEQGGLLNLNAIDKSLFKSIVPGLNPATSGTALKQIMPPDPLQALKTKPKTPATTEAPAASATGAKEATKLSLPDMNIGSAAKAIPGAANSISLTPKEILDLKKTVLTEWVPGQGDMQGKGIIDTILNRRASGHWGDSVTDVVNARKQFSAINGGIAFNGKVARGVDDIPNSALDTARGRQSSSLVDRWLAERAAGAKSVVGDHLNYANRAASTPNNWAWIDTLKGPKFGEHVHGTTEELQKYRPGEFGVKLANSDKHIDQTATGSISKEVEQAAKQAEEAQRKLAEQAQKAAQATKDVTTPLQSMDTGISKLAGSLQEGAPATNTFAGSIEKLLGKLLGGGGEGLGGLGGALGGALGLAEGGMVHGPGTSTSDSIPAMLSHGEFVVNAAATSKHGRILHAINEGRVPRFAAGGFVDGGLASYAVNNNQQSSVTHNNQRTVSQTLHLQAKDADSFRRSQGQIAAVAGAALSQAAARWR